MSDPYARYDYAWKTPGWTVQDSGWVSGADGYHDPGLPDDVTKVRVYGEFLEWDSGRPLEGVIRVRANKILTYLPENKQVLPGVKKVRFKQGGFSIMLPATDDPELVPNGFTYQCTLTVRGTTQEFEFTLPSIPTEVNITDLIPPQA